MHQARGDRYLSFERQLDRIVGPALVAALARGHAATAAASRPRRILLIKLHGIGNIVLLLPALRLLRRRFPDAPIDFLTFSTNAGILEGTAELERIHLLDRTNLVSLARSAAHAVSLLPAAAYDLVADFDQFAHLSTVAALTTRAPRRIGFLNPSLRRHRGYTLAVPCPDTDHVSRSFMRLAAAAAGLPAVPDIPPGDRRIALEPRHVAESAAFEAAEGIAAGAAMVLLHPGTSENLVLRRWPAENFAALADELAALPGVRIVVTGGPDERPLVERVRSAMRTPSASAAGRLSVKGFAALCSRARLVVANDTAAVHIASAMGTPVAGLYGPNDPRLYGPSGDCDLTFYHRLPCSPCITNMNAKLSSCRRARCMEALTVAEVFGAIRARYFTAAGTPRAEVRQDRGPGES